MSNFYCGAPRAKPVAPYLKPQWDDIPACGRQAGHNAGHSSRVKGRACIPKCLSAVGRRSGTQAWRFAAGVKLLALTYPAIGGTEQDSGKRQIFHLQIWADSVNYNAF